MNFGKDVVYRTHTDEPYLLTAARYVELNPTRTGLVNVPSRYRWSSAAAHVRGRDDILVRVAPLLKSAPPWRGFLARAIPEEDIKLLRAHMRAPAGRWATRSSSRRWKRISAESSGAKSPDPSHCPQKSSAGKPWDLSAKPRIRYGVPGTPELRDMVSPELRAAASLYATFPAL
jgi:hypothetical protein